MKRFLRTLPVLAASGGVLLALGPVVALASVGAGVGASPIVLSKTARPGHQYTLPALFVVNTGTDSAVFQVKVQRLEKGTEKTVPTAWIKVGKTTFRLGAQESVSVPLTLEVPAGASTGSYASDLVAGTASTPSGGGAALGASAATKLAFTVGEGSLLDDFSMPDWGPPALAGLAVVGLIVVLVRAMGLRLRIERK